MDIEGDKYKWSKDKSLRHIVSKIGKQGRPAVKCRSALNEGGSEYTEAGNHAASIQGTEINPCFATMKSKEIQLKLGRKKQVSPGSSPRSV